MRGKASLPIGFVVLGTALLVFAWVSGVALSGLGIGCIAGGLVSLAWRTGRHYQCGS